MTPYYYLKENIPIHLSDRATNISILTGAYMSENEEYYRSIKSCTYFYEPEQMITRFDPNDEYSLLNTGISVIACRVRGICYDTSGFYEKKYNKFDRRIRSKKPKRIKDL